ncbi:GNAT family N-acetyltransferase [Lachnospiraceae bacterium 56-18]
MENYGGDKKVFIRQLIEEDYPIYREVTYAHFAYKNVFTEKFMQVIWKEVNAANGLACAIIEKSTGEICGFCQLKHMDTPAPEVGIDIRDGYMGKGYAQEAVKLLMIYTSKNYNVDYFVWKAKKANSISRHIAEKQGGVLISEEPTMEQWIIDYGMEKGVLKEEDISYICTYRIERTN